MIKESKRVARIALHWHLDERPVYEQQHRRLYLTIYDMKDVPLHKCYIQPNMPILS
jgi:hypothetical protein